MIIYNFLFGLNMFLSCLFVRFLEVKCIGIVILKGYEFMFDMVSIDGFVKCSICEIDNIDVLVYGVVY